MKKSFDWRRFGLYIVEDFDLEYLQLCKVQFDVFLSKKLVKLKGEVK